LVFVLIAVTPLVKWLFVILIFDQWISAPVAPALPHIFALMVKTAMIAMVAFVLAVVLTGKVLFFPLMRSSMQPLTRKEVGALVFFMTVTLSFLSLQKRKDQ
jgi:hypothetical protein